MQVTVGPGSSCFGAGARGPGSLGLAPVVATASFPLINLPKFYLSFTILVSLILVKYPDRVGLVNAMIWPRILVFTSMMLRVLTQQPLAVMELEFIFLSWDWFPSMYVLFDLSQICMICWRAKLSYQFSSGTAKGAYGNSPKGGVFPGTSCSTFESNWWIVVIPRRP